MKTNINEEWTPVSGYVGLYEISNMGNVRSNDKTINCGLKNQKTVIRKAKIIKPSCDRYGYLKVSIRNNSGCFNKTIHRLVAIAFVENPYNYKCVNHKDGNKKNNHFSNLEWCSNEMNIAHGVKMGLFPRGEKSSQSKLSKSQVIKIRDEYPELSSYKLAKKYNVSRSNINSIIKRKTWNHF